MPTCGARLERVAVGTARLRERVLARCVAEMVDCPEVLDAAPAAEACVAAAGARCRARLSGLARLASRALRAAGACSARLQPGGILDDDTGLGYANLAPFCPRMRLRVGVVEDAIACQAQAVACTATEVVGTLAPRAGDLLDRAGVSLAEVRGCLVSRLCGNGVLDGDEECDDGPDNSDVDPDACRSTCLDPFCGDSVIDGDEDCDDGNQREGDGCDPDCQGEAGVCGNGILEEDEDCDDANRHDGDGCDSDCSVEAGTCGNGVLEEDEECDDGAGNSDTRSDRCRTDCSQPWCGDDVVDPGHGEECEPPGSILCRNDCTRRLPFAPSVQRARPPRSALAACQRAILAAGVRAVGRTRASLGGCVRKVSRCVLGTNDASDACLARANRACHGAVSRRDAAVAKLVAVALRGCRGAASEGPPSFDELLDEDDGLGFQKRAGTCPFDSEATPVTADLVTCVVSQARCLGERLVAQTVPRAYELLSELDGDPDERFACVVDPTDLEVGAGSPSGAFLADR
jgi:cysteine-rich repeat protein